MMVSISHTHIVCSMAAILLAGCAGAPAIPTDIASTGETGAEEIPDTDVGMVAMALYKGDRANSRGAVDADALQRSAHMLASLGAHPAEKESGDLATEWNEIAVRNGAAEMPPYRGRSLGPAYRKGSVAAGSSIALQQMFFAGKKAEISVVPSPNVELDLVVKSAKGKEICHSKVGEPNASCRWLPVYTSRYRIELVNKGKSSAGYYLVVN